MKRFILVLIGLVCIAAWLLVWGMFLVDLRPWDFSKIFTFIMSVLGGVLLLAAGSICMTTAFPPKMDGKP